MKIISIIPSSGFAGTEIAVVKTSIQLQTKGIESEIWSLSNSDAFDGISEKENITIRKFPISQMHPILSFLSFCALFKLARQYRKSHLFHSYLPKSILLTYFLHVTAGIKYVAGIRGKMNYRGRLVENLLCRSLHASEVIICNAEHLVKENMKRFQMNKEHFLVLNNFVMPRARINGEKSLEPKFVVVSNFLEYKGHALLLDAVGMLQAPPNIVLIGAGELKDEIENRIRQLSLQEVIRCVSGNELELHLTEATFAVHPSETEGFSNAILEEFSYGLPVIAFDVGGNSELIKDGYNGILLPERNARDLSESIEYLCSNPGICEKLGANALKTSKVFHPDKFTQQIIAVYRDFGIKAGINYV